MSLEYLYHYTSIDNLALILSGKKICFNSLANVDDVEEAETSDLANLGKYVYVSCWTKDKNESISLWKLYTPDMHGVRIGLPTFPFKEHYYKAGEYNLKEDIATYINLEELYRENIGMIIPNSVRLTEIEYTNEEDKLLPKIRTSSDPEALSKYLQAKTLDEIKNCEVTYDLSKLGKYKRDIWGFQKEWRYLFYISPMGFMEATPPTLQKHQELIRRLENPKQLPPYPRFFLDLDEDALKEAEIVLGPKMTTAEQILVEALLEKYGLGKQWRRSNLRIR